MSIRLKLFISHCLVILLPLTVVGYIVKDSIEKDALMATENSVSSLVDMVKRYYVQSVRKGHVEFGKLDPDFESGLKDIAAEKHPQIPADAAREQVRIRLADQNGKIFYDAENRSVGENISNWRDFRLAKKNGFGSRATIDPARGQLFIHVTVPMEINGKFMGVATASRSTAPIMGAIHQTKRQLYLMLAAAILFSIFISFLMTRYLTSPLKRLSQQARKIAAGEPDISIALAQKDEVGELSRAFAEMTRELEGKNYIEQFVSEVSHELKAPLTALRGSTEILLEGDENDPEVRQRFLRNILTETERLTNIVNGLLTLSKLDSRQQTLQAVDYNIADLANRVVSVFTPMAEKSHVRLRFEGEKEVRAAVDPALIERLLINLASNAINFTEENGEVCIISKRTPEGKPMLAVADTGVGIPPEHAAKIFNRFFTTVRPGTRQKGTGLGLAIVKRIVEAHRGEISVGPNNGRGTIFTVILPQ
jgi:signal transduction histidine kinase